METSEVYLQQIFTNAAVGIAIFQGADFVIEVANPVVCAIWGRTEADVLGKPLFAALPEAAGQGFEELLTGVMQTKQPFVGKELPATINRNGQFITVYFDFVYEPLPDTHGQVDRILVTASDATERRRARQQLERSENDLQTLFEQAPVAIAILRGPDLTYELANRQYLELVDRTTQTDLIGKPLLNALPELINQGLDMLIHTVIQTGTAYTAHEHPVALLRNGQLETGYYNFVYEPLRNAEGTVDGVFVVATNVTGQVVTQKKADQLLVQERELNDLKSNFLTLASHEFRTPMSMILSSASLIGRYNGVDEADKRERHVQRIKSSVHSLIGILSDFLSLSQMDEETLHGRPNALDLVSFCQEVVDDLQGLIKPDQRIVYRHLAGNPMVSIDGQMLKNILINLLVNASKYSSEGKEIYLTTTVQDNQLLFTVADEGIGIPDVDKDKLFVNFFRARNAMHMQGTGLGLYIVKRYVDLLGGSITFTSQLNAGTIFTVQLPITPPINMKTILVIDDIMEMRENITEILQLAPYTVVQAANGKEGIERARQTRPNLILCDIMMPELDGFGVLHILRKDPDLADIPFIFLTAKVESADFRFGMNLGADDYLTKPFDDLTLLNAVELRLDKAEHGYPDTHTNPAGVDQLKRIILDKEEDYRSLSDCYPTTQLNRKHRLFKPGNRPTALYFICQGKVKLFKADAAGNEYITTICGPGEFVGYVALLEETAYDETAELVDDALICTIPKVDFLSLIYQDQEVANRFIQTLAGDVAEHRERLLKLAYQSVRKRLAEALLLYQRKFYAHPADAGPADEPVHPATAPVASNTSAAMTLSRENWSHLVGASTETVIRILSDLRAEGLIDIAGSQITLLDIDKLTHLKR